MNRMMSIEELEKIIKIKTEEIKSLESGLFGLVIKHYVTNKKVISSARKLIRLQKSKKYLIYSITNQKN